MYIAKFFINSKVAYLCYNNYVLYMNIIIFFTIKKYNLCSLRNLINDIMVGGSVSACLHTKLKKAEYIR